MRIIAIKTLRDFWEKPEYKDAEQSLKAWHKIVKEADWESTAHVKEQFRHASFVGDRIVFNIAGNKYRLIIRIDYNFKIVFIRFIGTHQAYDKIDARTI